MAFNIGLRIEHKNRKNTYQSLKKNYTSLCLGKEDYTLVTPGKMYAYVLCLTLNQDELQYALSKLTPGHRLVLQSKPIFKGSTEDGSSQRDSKLEPGSL